MLITLGETRHITPLEKVVRKIRFGWSELCRPTHLLCVGGRCDAISTAGNKAASVILRKEAWARDKVGLLCNPNSTMNPVEEEDWVKNIGMSKKNIFHTGMGWDYGLTRMILICTKKDFRRCCEEQDAGIDCECGSIFSRDDG